MPTVSCIVTSYNNREWLQEAVLSVVGQTRPVDEIIVTDDASTDGSQALIEGLAARHRNIVPILRAENVGVSGNRDLAIDQASGDFITTLDGDDYYLPLKIESELRAIEDRKSPIAISSVRQLHSARGIDRFEDTSGFSQLDADGRIRWLITTKTAFPSEMLIRKDLHYAIGRYRHSLRTWEDLDYALRLAVLSHSWVHSGVEGTVHRGHKGGLSDMPPLSHARQRRKVMRLNRALICKHVGRSFYAAQVVRLFVVGLRRQGVFWARKRKLLPKGVYGRARG